MNRAGGGADNATHAMHLDLARINVTQGLGGTVTVRDVWAGRDLGTASGRVSATVCSLCTVVYRLALTSGKRIEFRPAYTAPPAPPHPAPPPKPLPAHHTCGDGSGYLPCRVFLEGKLCNDTALLGEGTAETSVLSCFQWCSSDAACKFFGFDPDPAAPWCIRYAACVPRTTKDPGYTTFSMSPRDTGATGAP